MSRVHRHDGWLQKCQVSFILFLFFSSGALACLPPFRIFPFSRSYVAFAAGAGGSTLPKGIVVVVKVSGILCRNVARMG